MKIKVNNIEQIDCSYVIDMQISPSFGNVIITSSFSVVNTGIIGGNFINLSRKEQVLEEVKNLKNKKQDDK